MKTICILAWITCCCAATAENLVDPAIFRSPVSFATPVMRWNGNRSSLSFDDGALTLHATGGVRRVTASTALEVGYETAGGYRVSFRCRTNGKVTFTWSFSTQERRLKNEYGSRVVAKAGTEWQTCAFSFDVVPEAENLAVGFVLDGCDVAATFADLSVEPIDPKPVANAPTLTVDGVAATAIRADGDAFSRHAAKIIRSQLWRTKKILLPLATTGRGAAEKGVIRVGGAASGQGAGGWSLAVTNGSAAVEGNYPGGLDLGAVAFLKAAGIEYFTPYLWRTAGVLSVPAQTRAQTPAVSVRLTGLNTRMFELLGYSDGAALADDTRIIGGPYRNYSHIAGFLLPYDEFGATHPEFFALQKDGKRLVPPKRNRTHYCMSNPSAMDIFERRVREYLRANPTVFAMSFFPGDGGGAFCRCEKCMQMGKNLGERNLLWANELARRIAGEFPNVWIKTFCYVDSRFPPETVKPAKNVLVVYCPYEPVWMNHILYDHPDNAQGLKDLDAWEAACPGQMGAFVYPSSCREKLNVWPAFYANYAKYLRFAKAGYRQIEYCGLTPSYGGGQVPDANAFAPLQRYVFVKVMIDPATDVEKEIDHFNAFYYGRAAQPIRDYFDLVHREARKRGWSQNTEKIVRGFFTKELVAKCRVLLDEAQRLAKGDAFALRHVQDERLRFLWSELTDICRGNGKVTSANLPQYAEELREFCVLAKTFGHSYSKVPYPQWFWDTALLKIGDKRRFWDDPLVQRLMADPLKTLRDTVPNLQTKTANGWAMPNEGILGGERVRRTPHRNQPALVTCVRRPSSGFGTVRFTFHLASAPSVTARLVLRGIDNEKTNFGETRVRVEVNGREIYAGAAPWKKTKWSDASIAIPAGALRAGENDFVVLNETPDIERDGLGGVNFLTKRNYYWGWFLLSDARLEL